MSKRTRTVVIGIVALVWGVNYTAPIWIEGYEPNEQLNIAFMTIIGVLFNLKRKAKDEEIDDNDNESSASKG